MLVKGASDIDDVCRAFRIMFVFIFIQKYIHEKVQADLPEFYLEQYWFIIGEVRGHSPESNFMANVLATTMYNKFENYTWKITATYPRDQWVDVLPAGRPYTELIHELSHICSETNMVCTTQACFAIQWISKTVSELGRKWVWTDISSNSDVYTWRINLCRC